MEHEALTTALVPLLKTLSDSERSFQRLLLQRGGPQDLGVIRNMMQTCLRVAQESKKEIEASNNAYLIHNLHTIETVETSPLFATLSRALNDVETPPFCHS